MIILCVCALQPYNKQIVHTYICKGNMIAMILPFSRYSVNEGDEQLAIRLNSHHPPLCYALFPETTRKSLISAPAGG